MAAFSPTFGLIGTVVGIVGVLKNISNPESLGPAMAMALSASFYGIFLANMVFLPLAGKLRTRSIHEIVAKQILAEGLLAIFFTDEASSLIEMRLVSYLQKRQESSAKAPAPAARMAEG
jgi:chemotaxis protein MotA